MKGMFGFENPIWKILNRVFDAMLLSLVWAFFSIPIFTIGASTTALYYTMMKIIKDQEGYILSDFFKAFKQNFKKATIIWILLAVIGAVLILDIFWYGFSATKIGFLLYCFLGFLGIMYSMTLLYIFPLLAKFENSIKNLLKVAMLLSIKHLLWTLLMMIIIAVMTVFAFFVPFIGLFYMGFLAFINCHIFIHIFEFYTIKEKDENKPDLV